MTKRIVFALCLAFAGCNTPASTTTTSAAERVSVPEIVRPKAAATPARPLPATDFDVGPLRQARSVGHTSLVFALTDASGQKLAYRPASKRSATRYRGEIAASRLASAWGLEEAPHTQAAQFPCSVLRSLTAADELLCDARQVSHGALTRWIPRLSFPALHEPAARARMRAWLRADGEIPAAERARARSLSRMILFDDVIANWDRWSGGNIGEANGALVFVDHDAAFYEPAPPAARTAHRLFEETDRMSRGFVDALRASEPLLADVVGRDDTGAPLLTQSQVEATRARAREALRIIDQKRKKLGDDAVLYFP